jgi:hypothetical protein
VTSSFDYADDDALTAAFTLDYIQETLKSGAPS